MPVCFRVVIADDERLIADTLGLILRHSGYDCEVAYSGNAALQRSISFQPALLISDVMMGDMNGVELAMRVRDALPGCAILLLSGQAGASDLIQQARAQGHNFDMLRKPVHPDELLAEVARRLKQQTST